MGYKWREKWEHIETKSGNYGVVIYVFKSKITGRITEIQSTEGGLERAAWHLAGRSH